MRTGGYSNANDRRKIYNPVQQSNILRLATVIWGPTCKDKIVGLLGHAPSAALEGQLNNMIGDRIGATTANPMYHMVQEAVESYDLGVNLRTMVRMSVRAATAGRDDTTNAWRNAVFDIRSRALSAVDHSADAVIIKHPGIRDWRLSALSSQSTHSSPRPSIHDG
jgi:hypothetical protein